MNKESEFVQSEVFEGEEEDSTKVEKPKTFEEIGRERMERTSARFSEVKDRIGGFMKNLWDKVKDYSDKTKEAVAGGAKKVFYTGLASPEIAKSAGYTAVGAAERAGSFAKEKAGQAVRKGADVGLEAAAIVTEKVDAGGAYIGEKYTQVVDVGKEKYAQIAEKAIGVKNRFMERVEASRERRRQKKEAIQQAKSRIIEAKTILQNARVQLAAAYML